MHRHEPHALLGTVFDSLNFQSIDAVTGSPISEKSPMIAQLPNTIFSSSLGSPLVGFMRAGVCNFPLTLFLREESVQGQLLVRLAKQAKRAFEFVIWPNLSPGPNVLW